MGNRKAVVFGASGLVGGHLLDLLVNSDQYGQVIIFNRSKMEITSPKVQQVLVDFDNLSKHAVEIEGDVLFCTLGSTISKAGSKEAFRKVDHQIPLELAEIAKNNHISNFIMLSSLGADKSSSNFYLHTKGSVELDVQRAFPFHSYFLRPSLLMGDRKEFRLGESIAKTSMNLLSPLMLGPLRKYKGIDAREVAAAMIAIDLQRPQKQFFESEELTDLAKAPHSL